MHAQSRPATPPRRKGILEPSTSPGRVPLELGFDGGQIMGAVVSLASADELDRALAEGRPGGLELDAVDGRYSVVLQRIVYVKRFARESRVGFGTL